MKGEKKVKTKIMRGGQNLDPTSSLNDYFLCICGKKYMTRGNLVKHSVNCDGTMQKVVCRWCNLEFKNRGNLVTHAVYLHGDSSYKAVQSVKSKQVKCDVCEATFAMEWKLRFHIRQKHFNLWAKVPHYEAKRVNQVWFEKVQNSNIVMEIRKTGLNTLVMKPTVPNADIKIKENEHKIDLRTVYPTGHLRTEEICKLCLKVYKKVDLKKHMDEIHFNMVKHKCNNCNMSFKRSYKYLQHICNRKRAKRKVVGVKQYSSIRITSVESLQPVEVD